MSPVTPRRDRILVVEDEGIVALELSERLTAMGFAVLGPTSTGEGAIAIALAERPDLILMDVRLKGTMDGPAAATRIRLELDVPFVFLTAYADEATLARVRPIEPHAYLIKPFEERALSVTIQLALYRHRAEQARREAEEALRRSEAIHRAVLSGSHDGIICVDAGGRITVFNQGAERIFGYPAAEIVGRPLETLVSVSLEQRHREEFERFRASGVGARAMGASREVVGRRRSGEEFPAEVTISRTRIDKEQVFTACVRDVSDRRALEAQFTRTQKMEAVGRLAASVAHDFNNLLAAVQNNVFLLKMEASSAQHEHLDEIGATVDRGVALTRQLLGFTRHRPEAPQIVDANEVVVSAGLLLRRLVRQDVVLRSSLGLEVGSVLIDRNLLEQVLMNLVVNARDAMPDGGDLVIRTGASLVGEGPAPSRYPLSPGPYVRIEVSDTGTGVPVGLEEQIFEAFFTTKPPGLGTGLGLSTVRSIVRRAGGDVTLSSGEGVGATFVVLIPQAQAAAGIRQRPAADGPAGVGTETILLVEDEVAVLRATTRILAQSGYRVLAALTCDEAMARAASEPIDLLLSDLVMPGCSGRELARRIVGVRPQVPVLFVTGYSHNGPDGSGVGPEPVLAKPVAPAVLLRVVRDMLDARALVASAAEAAGRG
jgi:PAS domain S-box-containing protein